MYVLPSAGAVLTIGLRQTQEACCWAFCQNLVVCHSHVEDLSSAQQRAWRCIQK
jgi:hypothetical protein